MGEREAAIEKSGVGSRRVVFVAIFLVITITFLLDGNVEGNELDTFALAKARMDPGYLTGDWRMQLLPGARLPFQLLLTPLLRFASFETTSIVGRLALYALLALGLSRLAVRLGLDAYGAVVAAGLFGYLDQHLAAGEFLVTGLESKSLAYGLALVALDSVLSRRWTTAAALAGLAVTFHPLVGGWCCVALVAAALGLERPARKELVLAAVVLLVLAAPGAWSVLSALRAHADPEGTRLYVYFRHPHHLDPAWFLGRHREPLIRVVLAVAIAVALFFVRFADTERRAMARFAQATMAVFCAGLLGSLLPRAERALSTYPFRVADTLFPLFVVGMSVALAACKLPARVRRLGMPAAATLVALLSIRAAVNDVQKSRAHEHEPVRGAYDWLRANTRSDALVLASPSLEYAGLVMSRPTVVSCKAVPTAPSDVVEWYRRLADLDGNITLKERGFPAFDEIGRGFDALPEGAIDALAAKYHARFLLARHGRSLPYTVVYDRDGWTVYALGG